MLPRRQIYRGLWILGRWQRFMAQRPTPLGRFVMAFALAAAVFGINTRMNQLYQAFALALALLLFSGLSAWLLQRRLRGRFQATRQLPRFATVGVEVAYPVRLRVERPQWLSGCSIEEQLPDPRPSLQQFLQTGDSADSDANRFDRAMGYPRWLRLIRNNRWAKRPEPKPLTATLEQGVLNEKLELLPLRRGYLRLPGLQLSRSDPLGLFRARVATGEDESLLVLPRRYPAPRINLPGRRQYQPGGMSLASSVGDSQEFIGLREYRSGDSPRNIHWPSWARSGKPQVKEYQDEFFTRHALVLDSFCNENPDARFEAAVSVAASLCESIQNDESLLDLMFVGADSYCFTSGRGLAGTEQFLEILACAVPCTDQPFERLQQSIIQRAGQLSAAVCILLDFDRPRRDLVNALSAAGLPLRVLLIAEEAEAEEWLTDWGHERPTLIRPSDLAGDLARL